MAEARLNYPLSDEDRIGNAFIKFRFYESVGRGSQTDGRGQESGVIDMYIPNGFQLTDQIQYSNTEFGLGGEGILRGDDADFWGDIRQSFVEEGVDLQEDRGVVGNLINDAVTVLSRSGRLVARTAASGIAPDAVTGAIGLRSGQIINPNVKATFRGVDIRSFSFTFNMIPSSSQEADTVSAIVRKFRSAAYPATTNTASGGKYSLFYKYPQKIEIVIYPSPAGDDGGNIIKFKDSYITNVSVTRNPTSTTFHADGYPVETVLSVTFTEQETLTQQDIADGF